MVIEVAVRDLVQRAELDAVCALVARVWRSATPPLPLPLLTALARHGGMVLGAYHDRQLVGAAVGLLGAHRERPSVHSHILGVDDRWQGFGVGTALKYRQRQWCLDRGINQLTWTFDPLLRRNAGFNIGAVGAVGTEYHQNYYGPMNDAYNAGMPTDRVLAHWELSNTGASSDRRRATVVLDVGERCEPVLTVSLPVVACLRVPPRPPDDPGLRLVWRHALRTAMTPLFGNGYRWTGVTREGWYMVSSGTANDKESR